MCMEFSLSFDEPKFYFQWRNLYTLIEYLCYATVFSILIEIYILELLDRINQHTTIFYLLSWFSIPTMAIIIILAYFNLKDKEMKTIFSIPIIKRPRNLKKKFRLWIKINKHNFIDWCITIGFVIGIFAPIRLLYYTYIGHFYGANLGILTVITLTMYVLIKKKKLGFIGRAFEKRVIRMTSRKLTRYAIVMWIFNVIFYGGMTLMFNYGDSSNTSDLQLLLTAAYLKTGQGLDQSTKGIIDPNTISYVMILSPDMLTHKQVVIFQHPIQMFVIIMSAFNKGTSSFFSYYTAFMFAEETEVMLLFFFEKRMYRKGMVKGTPWFELGFGKSLRKFIHQEQYIVVKSHTVKS